VRRKNFLAVLLLLICASVAWAQFETSAVLGFVRDSTGAPIANSKITLVNVSTGITTAATTDNDGHFQFPDVHVGRYKVTASAPGFSDSVTDPFAVNVSTRQRVDVTLKPGSVAETVVVSGARRAAQQS
jgi:hypothetical protein